MPLVSVIIPIYNERENIENCLKAIKAQNYPTIEIIVVDNGSTDNSIEAVKNYADKIVSEPRIGISFAKNSGVKVAEGEFIASSDADCRPDKGWIKELLRCFDNPSVASVGGANLIPSDTSEFEKCIDFLLQGLGNTFGSKYISNTKYISDTFHNPGCNVMYRKSVLEELGGFNERLLTVEDEELDFRIREKGYKILFTPFAKVYHKRKSNWKDFIKQVYRYAIGRAQFIKLHSSIITQWPRFIPSFFMLFTLILIVMSIFDILFFKILLIEILIGIAGLVLAAYYLALKSKKRNFSIYLLLLLFVFWVWGIGLIRGIWYKQKG